MRTAKEVERGGKAMLKAFFGCLPVGLLLNFPIYEVSGSVWMGPVVSVSIIAAPPIMFAKWVYFEGV